MTGRVVLSKAGRDKGKLLAVIKEENGFVYLCDGKERPVKRPKRKKLKHVEFMDGCVKDLETNRSIKKALYEYKILKEQN